MSMTNAKTMEIAERLWRKHVRRERTEDGMVEIMGEYEFEKAISEAIQEATASMFTEEDMFNAFMRRQHKTFIAEGLVKSFADRDAFNKYIEQYRKEKQNA